MRSVKLASQLRRQAQYPFKPFNVIKRDMDDRVSAMIAYAYRHVPYYHETMRRIGLYPHDFTCAEDLSKLPLIGPDEYKRDPEYFFSSDRKQDQWLQLRTAGTTGEPRPVFHDAESLFQSAAHSERRNTIVKGLLGKTLGYGETIIASSLSTGPMVQKFIREHGLFPRKARIRRQFLSILDAPEKNVRLVNTFKPDVLHSLGSYLGVFFPHLIETGTFFHKPKVITYSSDELSEKIRNVIQKEFNIHVLSIYHSVEAFEIGFECEHHRGLHLNIDLYPLRIIDSEGQDCKPGDSGEVVVSNLVNRATVLLNYRIGDIAAILPDRCPCGRSLPLLTHIMGRSDDWIKVESGEYIHPRSVRGLFMDEDSIWQYQIVQDTVTHFSIRIVPDESCDRRHTRERIKTKFARVLGEGVTIDVSFVDSIDRTAGGKSRVIISKYNE